MIEQHHNFMQIIKKKNENKNTRMFMQTYETFNFNELTNTYNEEKVLTKFIKNILKDVCSSNTVLSHFHHIFVLAIDHCSFFCFFFFKF